MRAQRRQQRGNPGKSPSNVQCGNKSLLGRPRKRGGSAHPPLANTTVALQKRARAAVNSALACVMDFRSLYHTVLRGLGAGRQKRENTRSARQKNMEEGMIKREEGLGMKRRQRRAPRVCRQPAHPQDLARGATPAPWRAGPPPFAGWGPCAGREPVRKDARAVPLGGRRSADRLVVRLDSRWRDVAR